MEISAYRPSEIKSTVILVRLYDKWISTIYTMVLRTTCKLMLALRSDKSEWLGFASNIWFTNTQKENARCWPSSSTKFGELMQATADQFDYSCCRTIVLFCSGSWPAYYIAELFLLSTYSRLSETDAGLGRLIMNQTYYETLDCHRT